MGTCIRAGSQRAGPPVQPSLRWGSPEVSSLRAACFCNGNYRLRDLLAGFRCAESGSQGNRVWLTSIFILLTGLSSSLGLVRPIQHAR